MKNIKLIVIAILSFIASINAGYLTYSAYQVKAKIVSESFCDINSTFSCTSVFNNDFAWFWGIPFSEIALVVYPILVWLAIWGLKWNTKKAYLSILVLSVWWLAFNSWIIFNEYAIWTYCILCLICTLIITINWILSVIWLKNFNSWV